MERKGEQLLGLWGQKTIPLMSVPLHVPNENHPEISKEEWKAILDILKMTATYFTVLAINNILGWVWWLMSVIPALWEANMGRSPEIRSLRPAWPTWRNPILTKNTKISRAWWQAPVIPVTQEAEAGVSLEPTRWRLQ